MAVSHLLEEGLVVFSFEGAGVELERRTKASFLRLLPFVRRAEGLRAGSMKASIPRVIRRGEPLGPKSSLKKTWLRSSSTVLEKLLRDFFRAKLISKTLRFGNISDKRASFSTMGKSSSTKLYAWPAAIPSLSGFVPSSLSIPNASKGWEILVMSVSSVRESTSPFNERARSGDPCALASSLNLLLPDGSNTVLSSTSAPALTRPRMARASFLEASNVMSKSDIIA